MNHAAPALDWLQMGASFVLVLVLMGALLWLLRRLQQGQGLALRRQDALMQVLATHSVGTRQKLILVRVRDHEVLLGATPQAMTALHTWPATPNHPEELA